MGPSSVIASLRINMGLDPSGVSKGTRQAEAELSRFQKVAKSTLGQGLLQGVGLGAGLGATQAIAMGVSKAIDFTSDAITMASDLAETQTKLDAVFKDSADAVREWSETTDAAIITTKNDLLAAAAGFGNFLQAMGVGRLEAVKYSTTLTALSADLASFNNLQGGAEEAAAALRSGMAGETEAAMRLGINLKVARLEADLLASGQKQVNGVWTSAQLAAARYNAILKDTASAQGDVANTAGGFANKARALEKNIAELQTGLGEFLLPGALAAVTVLTDATKAVKGLADAIPSVTNVLGPLVAGLAGLAALKLGAKFLTAMIPGGGKFAAALSSSIGGPLGGVATKLGLSFGKVFGLAAAGAVAVVLFDELDKQFSQTIDLIGKVQKSAEAVKGALSLEQMQAQVAVLDKALEDLSPRRREIFQPAADFMSWLTGGAHVELGDVAKDIERQRTVLLAEIDKVQSGLRSAAADPKARQALEDIWSPGRSWGDALGDWKGRLAAFGALEVTPPSIADPLDAEFDKAVKVIGEGFGNIKAALKDPPQIISREDRLENQSAKRRKVMQQLHKAVAVDDPLNIAHWTGAAAKIDRTIARLSGGTRTSMRAVNRTLRTAAGKGTAETEKAAELTATALPKALAAATPETGTAAAGMATAAKAPIAPLPGIFWRSGVSAGALYAAGLASQVERVTSAGILLAQAAAAPIETHSPPKVGPLRGISLWGPELVDLWVDPMMKKTRDVEKVGERLGRALRPKMRPLDHGGTPGWERASRAGVRALAGDGVGRAEHHHYHVGTLIANDAGLRDFERRREGAVRQTRRQRRRNRLAEG